MQMFPRICFLSEQLPQCSGDDREVRCLYMNRMPDREPPGITGLTDDLPGDNSPTSAKETREMDQLSGHLLGFQIWMLWVVLPASVDTFLPCMK